MRVPIYVVEAHDENGWYALGPVYYDRDKAIRAKRNRSRILPSWEFRVAAYVFDSAVVEP